MAGSQGPALRATRLASATGAIALVASLLLTVQPAFAKEPAIGPVEVSGAIHTDVSEPVRDLVGVAPSNADEKDHEKDKPLRPLPNQGNAYNQPDGAIQGTAGAAAPATPGLGFPGVGQGDYGFSDQYAPPDTNGAVGATQYVQWVNTYFAVFDKATGAIAAGFPKSGNSLWAGFGGGCQTNNDGDPIVQYDQLAQRWILTQFSVSTTPYLQCVAVSTTSDATGSYYRYSFSYGTSDFNDYPKVGVWPDGYYVSYNIFTNGQTFAGSKVCAMDRAKMLVGDTSATQQCFQLSNAFGGLLPSDLDGSTPPPAGAPNPFLNFGSNALNRWQFHVDWANAGNSTLTGPTSIPVDAFSPACNGGTCIPQPGVTQQLDSLADRLMYRLAYRNFGDHESLVVNHSVTAGTSVGVRWYEIRNPNGSPSVYQQGTYAPDATYRWMGSIAQDAVGDIALGYSGSSSSVFPYVAYAGRVPSDPLGTLSAETVAKAGGGSQKCPNILYCRSLSRWGDYSAMQVDPVDDCTFWYTNEYEKTQGAFNWSTWITSFKFPNCSTNQTPVLTSIAVTPASASVQTGGTQQFSATAKDQFGQPMSPQPAFTWGVSGGGSIDTSGLFTAGASAGGPFSVTAQAGGKTGSASVTVTQVPVLTTITVAPASASVQTGASQQFTATAKDQNGQPMSPQPAFTWGVDPGAGTIDSNGKFTAGATAGGPFSVTAQAGGKTGSASVTVTAPPPGDFSLSSNPTSRSIRAGTSTTYAITIARTNGFAGAVAFTVSGLPSGASASFSPTSTTGNTSTLTVQTATGVRGSFSLTITGTSGSLTHSTPVTLVTNKGGK